MNDPYSCEYIERDCCGIAAKESYVRVNPFSDTNRHYPSRFSTKNIFSTRFLENNIKAISGNWGHPFKVFKPEIHEPDTFLYYNPSDLPQVFNVHRLPRCYGDDYARSWK